MVSDNCATDLRFYVCGRAHITYACIHTHLHALLTYTHTHTHTHAHTQAHFQLQSLGTAGHTRSCLSVLYEFSG